MNKFSVYLFAASLVLGTFSGRGDCTTPTTCSDCGAAAQKSKLVDCVIWVPKMCVETVMRKRCVHVKETREETYTVFEKRPVKKEIKREYCYLDTEIKTKEIECEKCHIVEVPQTKTYPPKECKTCGGKGKGKGEIVSSKPATEEGCRKVVATAKTKKEKSYCVKVPKYREEVCAEIETFELVPVERTRTVAVRAPKIVEYPCEVKVKKWFPKTVKCCPSCSVKHPKK